MGGRGLRPNLFGNGQERCKDFVWASCVGHDQHHFREHYLWVCCSRTMFPGCFRLCKNSPTEERLDRTSDGLGQGYVVWFTWEVTSADILWQATFLLFVDVTFVFVIGKGKQFTKKKNEKKRRCFWPRPSVVVHSTCCPIGKSSGRCPKRCGGPCTTPSQSLRSSPTSQTSTTTIRSPASCLRWTRAVQCCQADLMVRHRRGCRWEFVSHECDRFFSDNREVRKAIVLKIDDASFAHAFPRAWRWVICPCMPAVGNVHVRLVWKFLASKLRPSRIKSCIETASRILWHAFTVASRAQPVSSFLIRLELWMFELRLWVLRETCWSQRACLRRNPAAFALIPDNEAWEVRSLVKWVLSLLVLSLTLPLPPPPFFFLLFSPKVSGLQARASAHYTEHVPGRTLKGNVCQEGCCWRCPFVNVQGSSSGRSTSPATLQKKKKKKNNNERAGKTYLSFIECSTPAREASVKNLALWRSTEGLSAGRVRCRFIFAPRRAFEVLRWILGYR